MVRNIAYTVIAKVPGGVVDVDDLIQVGSIGLAEAESRYNADQNPDVPFEAYATVRIKGAMIDELRKHDVLSRTYRKQRIQADAATQKLYHILGRKPTNAEVAAQMGISLDKYNDLCHNINVNVVSMEDLKVSDDAAEDFLEFFFVDTEADPLNILQHKERNNAITQAFKNLPHKDRMVLQMSYAENKTLKEIGKELGVTEARAHQLRKAAVDKIRLTLEIFVL